MLSFMHAQYTFFQQGYSLLHELDPYMKKLASELDQLVIDSAVEKREMEHKHALIQQRTLLQVSIFYFLHANEVYSRSSKPPFGPGLAPLVVYIGNGFRSGLSRGCRWLVMGLISSGEEWEKK
nr:arf-GAP with coiled-coil, ANK repeat and PH domain-containing protein 3-like [Anolis sagrei ordinatus]